MDKKLCITQLPTGAIEMAKDVLKDGKDSAVKALANLVATVQDSEILEMKKLLG